MAEEGATEETDGLFKTMNAKQAAEDRRDVSLMPSKSGSHRKIGDMPGGLAWGTPHKGTRIVNSA